MMLFGFFALILVLVSWVNRAVVLLDRLIADGQTALVFLEFTALTLPFVIMTVLPTAAFAASVYVANRMSSDSELTVVQAMGYSAARVSRAVVIFGVIITVFLIILAHILVPMSRDRLADRQAEVAENLTARLLVEGQFLHPTDGVTFYVRDISETGELRDIFLSDVTDPKRQSTYTAQQAYLVKSDDGPQLVMLSGMSQTFNAETEQIFVARFDDFVFGLGQFLGDTGPRVKRLREFTTLELIFPSDDLRARPDYGGGDFMWEVHGRTAQPLFAMAAAMVGFVVVLVGGFSRFGVWRHILTALTVLIILLILESMARDAVSQNPDVWYVLYIPSALGVTFASALLVYQARPRLRRAT